jgi:hypothetical protein
MEIQAFWPEMADLVGRGAQFRIPRPRNMLHCTIKCAKQNFTKGETLWEAREQMDRQAEDTGAQGAKLSS